jgi:hypothetical protein
MDITNSITMNVKIDPEALGLPKERYEDAEEVIQALVTEAKVKIALAIRELQTPS